MNAKAPIIGILDHLDDPSVEREVLGPEAHILCFLANRCEDLPDEIESIDVALLWHDLRLEAAAIERMRSCRAIVRTGVGFDNVDLAAAGRLGIPVVNVPDYGTNDVADHTFALFLAVARGLLAYDHALRRDLASGWEPAAGGRLRRITGRTFGIVGLGRIGSAVAHRARALGLRVGFYDPYVPAGIEKSWQIRRFGSLDTLLRESDVVSLHVPETEETRNLIDADKLALLPPDAILLNTARGSCADLDAVAEALREGRLAGFGADVLSVEPPASDHSLVEAWRSGEPGLRGRVVLTPHCAFWSEECRRELRDSAARKLRMALDGDPLPDCVNLEYLDGPPRTPVAGWK